MTAAFDTGFSVREAMWHGQGEILTEAPANVDEFLVKAGLTWEPADDIMWQKRYEMIGSAPEGSIELPGDNSDGFAWHMVPVPGRKLIVRNDTQAVLGTPSEDYARIYNRTMAELIEAVSNEARGKIEWETGGSAEGGAKTWAVALLNEPFTVGKNDGDPIFPYFTGLNAHDGGGSLRILPSNVRTVCRNTWNAAFAQGERHGHMVTIRHSGNVAERIEQAKEVLSQLRGDADQARRMFDELNAIHVSDALVDAFAERFIPTPENSTTRLVDDRRARRQTFLDLYHGRTPAGYATQAHIAGTAYGLVSAAVEYLDHLRPYRNADTYLSRTMLHNAESRKLKANVLRLTRELVDNFDGDSKLITV